MQIVDVPETNEAAVAAAAAHKQFRQPLTHTHTVYAQCVLLVKWALFFGAHSQQTHLTDEWNWHNW